LRRGYEQYRLEEWNKRNHGTITHFEKEIPLKRYLYVRYIVKKETFTKSFIKILEKFHQRNFYEKFHQRNFYEKFHQRNFYEKFHQNIRKVSSKKLLRKV